MDVYKILLFKTCVFIHFLISLMFKFCQLFIFYKNKFFLKIQNGQKIQYGRFFHDFLAAEPLNEMFEILDMLYKISVDKPKNQNGG
jgi:hypothetical protein